jgi:hypothetical protein
MAHMLTPNWHLAAAKVAEGQHPAAGLLLAIPANCPVALSHPFFASKLPRKTCRKIEF